MLFPALFVLFAAAAAIDEEHECRLQAWMACDVESLPDEIPDSMEDLKRDCKVVQDALKCTMEENAKCKAKAFDSTALRKFFQFMETNCDEDSSLYQTLSRNYECIQPIAENLGDQCRASEGNWEELEELVEKAGELSLTAGICIYPLYEITCTAHIIGMHCGQEAKETVTEILQNLKFDFRLCNEESILNELQPLKEIFESTFNEALEVENAILKEIKDVLDK